MSDEKDGEVKERLTRLEERLIAERSVRKTRDDQLFSFISEVHKDLERQDHSLDEISESVGIVRELTTRMDEKVTRFDTVAVDSRDNRDSIKEIQGSIQTLKWVWPLLVTLISVIFSLFVANVDLKFSKKVEEQQQIEVDK